MHYVSPRDHVSKDQGRRTGTHFLITQVPLWTFNGYANYPLHSVRSRDELAR